MVAMILWCCGWWRYSKHQNCCWNWWIVHIVSITIHNRTNVTSFHVTPSATYFHCIPILTPPSFFLPLSHPCPPRHPHCAGKSQNVPPVRDASQRNITMSWVRGCNATWLALVTLQMRLQNNNCKINNVNKGILTNAFNVQITHRDRNVSSNCVASLTTEL